MLGIYFLKRKEKREMQKRDLSEKLSIMIEDHGVVLQLAVKGFAVRNEQFMQVAGTGEKGHELFVARVLLLFKMSVREASEIHEYTFLQYMEIKHVINMFDEMLGCVCLQYSADNEVHHSLGRTCIETSMTECRKVVWFEDCTDYRRLCQCDYSKSYERTITINRSVPIAPNLSEQFLQ